MNDIKVPAGLSDGVSGSPLMGQTNKIENFGTPAPLDSLKNSRNTGEIKSGTNFLRANAGGKDNSMQSE